MFVGVAIFLFLAWAFGVFAVHMTGWLIHVLIVVAVIAFIAHLLERKRGV